ncbi:NAD(P)/FAD-dependent oxidoreductase [Sphingomonas sp. UYP23]
MAQARIIVVGAGFAGLQLVKRLQGARVSITLVDRRNHHLFQPLLYQAATSILSPAEVSWPIRQILRDRGDVEVLLGQVVAVDRKTRKVELADGARIPFDVLVIATGVAHTYFGHDEWRVFAPGLKTGADATAIRNRILSSLELAERATSDAERSRLMTFVVIGGGPTGVELAGIIADLTHSAFPREFRHIDTRASRVVLVEAGPSVLPTFDRTLSTYAEQVLVAKGVELRLGAPVVNCDDVGVVIEQERVAARTIIWAAGVRASPAAEWLGVAADRAGRVCVRSDLSIEGDQDIFVIGDTAAVLGAGGTPVPGLAPAAKQQGDYVARRIIGNLSKRPVAAPFRYKHQGSLATIGHRAAVADFGRIKLKGYLAWWVWGVVHILFLVGARSRVAVTLNWLWTYLKGRPSARILDEQ